MIKFNEISLETFLADYWQKKPLLIKQAYPNFISPISPEELAGLSLEEEIESRIIVQHSATDYRVSNGPFTEETYQNLPKKEWTLLVQGMDKLLPSIHEMLDDFDFIPRWRIDDVMISYAADGGNVGPHYDHYDVFLLQGAGRRKWQITSQNCTPENYMEGLEVRLMKEFAIEQEFILEAGDILYLPPKWGHHGVALDNKCMTFSFGYRSYQGQELWDSFGDYLSENGLFKEIYQDPNWNGIQPAEISNQAWLQAKDLLAKALTKDDLLQDWFGRFATQLDPNAHNNLPEPLEADETASLEDFVAALADSDGLVKDPVCRFAYQTLNNGETKLYINGFDWNTDGLSKEQIAKLANQIWLQPEELIAMTKDEAMAKALHALWERQFFIFKSDEAVAYSDDGEDKDSSDDYDDSDIDDDDFEDDYS